VNITTGVLKKKRDAEGNDSDSDYADLDWTRTLRSQ
jgi:hypothetical protein